MSIATDAATANSATSASPSDAASAFHQRLPLILGTSSKWRAALVRETGLRVARQLNPDIDERAVRVEGDGQGGEGETTPRERSDPAALARAVAKAKAAHLLRTLSSASSPSSPTPRSLLLTLDQVAHFDGVVREKPVDESQCRAWLSEYSSAPVRVVTALVLVDTTTGRRWEGSVHASQLFAPLPAQAVDQLIAKGDVLHCCGGFLVDDPLVHPYLREREGTEDEIVGMPKRMLLQLVQQAHNDIEQEEQRQQQQQSESASQANTAQL